MTKIAIFASGSGSNAENIYNYFKENAEVEITFILTNNPNAGVIERANRMNIPVVIFNKFTFNKTEKIIQLLKNQGVDWVILAGFLWLIPKNLTLAYSQKIVNIHPALLPKFGGKGMWGHHVHEAVVAQKETESGITIHFVNERYDEGEVIFQAKCAVNELDTPEDVASKIHELEYEHFPRIIEKLIFN